mgnify:CR=1 FL=1
MSKNYFLPKTGHEASDEYFKKAPIYCDSDIMKMFLHGWFLGCVFTCTLFVVFI